MEFFLATFNQHKSDNTKILMHEYAQVLADIKKRVQESQIKAALSVNKEMMQLYWFIGSIITEKQERCGWGTGIIDNLVEDLQKTFPGIKGFSRINIFRMRAFYLAYEKVSQAATQITNLPIFNIPWFHNVVIIHKIKNNEERLWYAQNTITHGWSRSALELHIKSNLYVREGKSVNNFQKTLPAPHSELAQQTLKDPYVFDFLTLHQKHLEKDLEQGLIDHLQKFLLELGQGFAFMGRQVAITVDEKDYYVDLLFYHSQLHCYVIVDLKAREFEPRDAGQINFYRAVIDNTKRGPNDNPTIGIIICKSKSKLTVEYSLQGNINPIAVSSYKTQLYKSLPKNLKSSLPTVEEIEIELEKQELLSKKLQDESI